MTSAVLVSCTCKAANTMRAPWNTGYGRGDQGKPERKWGSPTEDADQLDHVAQSQSIEGHEDLKDAVVALEVASLMRRRGYAYTARMKSAR